MPHQRRGLRYVILGLAAAGLMLTGCSKDVSTGKLENEIVRVYEEQGDTISDVSCEGELKGEVGATQECTATINEVDTDLTATVEKIDGSTVRFTTTFSGTEVPEGEPTDEPTGEPTQAPTEEPSE